MLKRNHIMLIAVGLLGANVSLAAAAESPFPPQTDEANTQMLPAQEQYFRQREAANPNPSGASSPAWASGIPGGGGRPLPALVKYLDQQAAQRQAASASAPTERTVKTTAATKYLNVAHEEIVKIVNEKGQSFAWKADTLGEADLPLQAIAPRDFAAGQTRVFVRHPYQHTIRD